MKREEYEKSKGILSEIDNLNESANITKEIIENIRKHGGNAKMYIRTNDRDYTIELTGEILDEAVMTILKKYNDKIKAKTRDLVESVECALITLK